MLLEKINSSQELKALSLEELTALSAEIRARMVAVVSKTGGHLASSLGAVELCLALHYCLDTPKDKIVFDVGHQAYCHKLVTGRNGLFDTLRTLGGLSGFPCKGESEYDTFTTGHSSNAVSLALGLACARDLLPEAERFRVAAVIGDGSLSGGLCFEGLNNAGHLKKDMLVILNTNELSIAAATGAISTYLNKLISLPVYNRFKENFTKFVTSRVPRGSRLLKMADKFEEGLKGLFIPGILFEELGFRYFGPLDGNNLNALVPTLKNILDIKGPRLVHIITKKGKGYAPAEEDPIRFHGIGAFDPATGCACEHAAGRSFTQVFGEGLAEAGKEDPKIVAVTAAMAEGTGLGGFRDLFPQRFFDVGIAEGHAVCFASGLAAGGFKPVVAVYSTFLQRAYDQLMQEISLQGLPCVIAVDRAGLVGEDGMTHQGIFDIAYLRSVPNLEIMAPCDAAELKTMLKLALASGKPACLRFPRAQAAASIDPSRVVMGKASLLREGTDFCLISLGPMTQACLEAREILEKEGFSGSVINARFVRPLDVGLIREQAQKTKWIFTVEEGIIDGGFGCAVADCLAKPVVRLGLPNQFIQHGKRELLLEKYGLDAKGICRSVRNAIKGNGQNKR